MQMILRIQGRKQSLIAMTLKESILMSIRYHVDKLELLVDDQYWLLPKYREMLFLR